MQTNKDYRINERSPNFRDKTGKLFLVRCYVCVPGWGQENWAPAVATGKCEWCGWPEENKTHDNKS